jgi:hypothetical protein
LIHSRNTTTAAIDPCTLHRARSAAYQENSANAARQSTAVRIAPGHTSRKRIFTFGTKRKTRATHTTSSTLAT